MTEIRMKFLLLLGSENLSALRSALISLTPLDIRKMQGPLGHLYQVIFLISLDPLKLNNQVTLLSQPRPVLLEKSHKHYLHGQFFVEAFPRVSETTGLGSSVKNAKFVPIHFVLSCKDLFFGYITNYEVISNFPIVLENNLIS